MVDGKESAPPWGSGDPPKTFPLGLALAFYAALALVAVVWRMAWDGVLPLRPVQPPGDTSAWLQVAWGSGAGMLAVGISRLWTRWAPGGPQLADALAAAVGPLRPGEVWLLAGASGLAEELFFRGALQPRVGLVWASLLFGLAHFVPRAGLRGWSLYAAVVGAAFGALFEELGSVLAPVLAHILVNGVNLGWLSRRSPR